MGLDEKAQTRTIGDDVYRVHPVAFGVGRKALIKLVKIVAPMLAAASAPGTKDDKIAALLTALPESLSEDDVEYFADVMGAASWIDHADGRQQALVKQNRELLFGHKYLEFFQWLGFALEVNYAPFFSGVKDALAGFIPAVETPTPKKSTAGSGLSGES